MSATELLHVDPLELKFPFELKKHISCSLQLTNKIDNHVAFKVKTTNPKNYCVRPNTGVVSPRSSCNVTVTMQAQKEAPLDMQCKDKFLLQSVNVSPVASTKDITPDLFHKESGNHVEECKLRVVYVPPPQPPSPVREVSEEGSSPITSASENGTINVSDSVSRAHADPKENSLEVKSLISRLTEEKKSVWQQINKLQREWELLNLENDKNRGGISRIYVILAFFVGILVGCLVKRT